MLNDTMKRALNFYDHFHCLIIVNKDGVAEYSIIYDEEKSCYVNDEVTGMHILEVYPHLTEDTSSVMRCLKSGKEILNEEQTVVHFRGKSCKLLNSDFPIIINGETVGVIEVSVVLERYDSIQSKEYLKRISGSEYYTLDDIVTQNNKLLDIKEKIKSISKTDSSVLIYGETGTGKEMVAQAIHSHSNRYNKPFISQNCAAIPSTLLESIFFGTEKGAYTGAENKPGLFEIANGGTLFLDEINSMDIVVQAKILKAIEEKRIKRVGGIKDISTNVRIISALNILPEVAIKENRLREDLFYRLSVVQIEIPPLRQRKEDIDLLIDYFIDKYNKEMSRNIISISELARDILCNHEWRGNVRELQNVIESVFNVVKTNTITVKDIPQYLFNKNSDKIFIQEDLSNVSSEKSLQELVDEYEKTLIVKAINSSKNLSQAAKRLKISNQLLQYKIYKYNLRKIVNSNRP